MKTNKQIQLLVGIVVSVVCVTAVFWLIDPAEVVVALQEANFAYLGLTGLYIVVYMGLRALRWRYLLQDRVGIRPLFHVQNMGAMLTQLLPLRLGDVARAVMVGQMPRLTVAQGMSTMMVERVLDMLLIVLLLPLTLSEAQTLPTWMQQGAKVSSLLAGVVLVVLMILVRRWAGVRGWLVTAVPRSQKFLPQADNLMSGLNALAHWRSAFFLFILTVFTWLPVVLAYSSALIAVNLPPDLNIAAFVMCAGALSVAAPSSPGQIGVFHVGVTSALALWGQPEAAALSLAILYHAANFVVMVLLGVVGFLATQVSWSRFVALRSQEMPA
ncbi:MAG: flippase-like domain-containing protein [Ardenticatenaceae bacterium]|nr:flippase-like domain-containing protein [Ardenticatenaceae bacterium]